MRFAPLVLASVALVLVEGRPIDDEKRAVSIGLGGSYSVGLDIGSNPLGISLASKASASASSISSKNSQKVASKTSSSSSASKTSSSSTTKATAAATPTAKVSSTSSPSKTSSTTKSSSSSSKTSSSSSKSSSSSSKSSSTTSKSSSSSSKSSSSSSSSSKSSTAAVAASTGCSSVSGDAPYSVSCGDLAGSITFPNGFQNKAGGIVFLVHGTGSTGDETWGAGPYNTMLPNKGIGYDIAWVTIPGRALNDAQINAEYVAYNIKVLAEKSRTKKVFLIGHSQGNLNIQWALNFWPSMRRYVSGYSSIAGDFHGTAEGPLLCTVQDLLQGGCEPSVIQQSVGSKYLAASNARGNTALVSTTSIYTIFDDIIQPEVIDPTSILPSASNIAIQSLCGPAYIVDHFEIPFNSAAFYLTYDALTHGGIASTSRFDPLKMCTYLAETSVPNPFITIPAIVRQAALDAIGVLVYEPKIFAEPRLMDYVCKRGDASGYCVSSA